jgi:hypothetical protein
MVRIWRIRAGTLLVLCLALDLMGLVVQFLADAPPGAHPIRQLLLYEGSCLLLWRVWRGGQVAWSLLIAWNGLSLAFLTLAALWPWNAYVYALVASAVAQLVLLASPAVRSRVRSGPRRPRHSP